MVRDGVHKLVGAIHESPENEGFTPFHGCAPLVAGDSRLAKQRRIAPTTKYTAPTYINLQAKRTPKRCPYLVFLIFSLRPGAFSSFSRKSRRFQFFCPARNTRRGQRPQGARGQGAAFRPNPHATRPRPPPPRRQGTCGASQARSRRSRGIPGSRGFVRLKDTPPRLPAP